MGVEVLGTHFTYGDFNVTQVDRGYTCGIGNGADNPCSAANILVYDGGRRGSLGLNQVRASGRIRNKSAAPVDDAGTSDGRGGGGGRNRWDMGNVLEPNLQCG